MYVPWIALFDIGLAPQIYCTYDDLVLRVPMLRGV